MSIPSRLEREGRASDRPSPLLSRDSTLVVVIFTVATFLNAALLFAVQPMFTKMVLPLLGGTPSVWNTCLMSFQLLLLAGYLYAHLTSRWFSTRTQGLVHLALLVVSLVFVPIALPSGAMPQGGTALPVVWLVALLLVSLGLPFLLLSAGAPMIQRWLSTTNHSAAKNPYVLYVASNLGSFAALLAYPLVIEPWMRLSEQRVAWGLTYLVLIAVVLVAWLCAVRLARTGASGPVPGPGDTALDPDEADIPRDFDDADAAPAEPWITPNAAWRLRWVLLAFAPSSLLLGVTNYLSTDVAAFPLLWVVPLALYLLTFVIVFAQRPILSRHVMLPLHVFLGLALVVFIAAPMTKMLTAFIVLHLLGFFVTAMVCHRELADSRPRVEYLTEYYLWMSVGGALGGAFNVLLAPALYERVLEYPFALIIAFALRPAQDADRSSRRRLLDLGLPSMLYLSMLAAYELPVVPGRWGTVIAYGVLGAAAGVVAIFHRRPLRLALGAVALFFAIDSRTGRGSNVLVQERSFFGVYKVHRWGDYHALQHGTTTHGGQSIIPEQRREPLTYYSRSGPLGDAFTALTDSTARRNVALVGLGTGTTACYANPGERWTYYEIDPVVVRIARAPALFTYLRDCGQNFSIVLGDARLSLTAAPDSSFDLIVLDAFSSDAIPIHLMTREALQLYLRKLRPNGTALFHISNRYLDLEPVLVELARDARLAGAVGVRGVLPGDEGKLIYGSRWVALSRRAAVLGPLLREREWYVLPPQADVGTWTDDYSDVLSVVKWR